ncbi:MAG: M23 family metallopeptidase [Actinomycetota bacterium]|nr:M23 family metallopeptidase [Actinomycetota bacterium]
MSNRRKPHILIVLLVLALLALSPVGANAQSKGQVEEAKTAADQALEALEAADAELEAGLEYLEEIQGQIYNLNWRMDKLSSALAEYGTNVANLEDRARNLVVDAYTNGGRSVMTTAFTAGNIQELITTQALYDRATTLDLAELDQLGAVRRQMDRLTVELLEKEGEAEVLEAEQAVVVASLSEIQGRADAIHAEARTKYRTAYAAYKARLAREAAARAARASGPSAGIPGQTKGVVCPVKGSNYFINSWGYPRSGGRTHKGTDLMASYNTELVAMTSGSVRLNTHSLGGRQVYVYGDDGVTYYYAHLSKWPSGLSTGQRVNKGQTVGFVGDSGNAAGTPHLHLGMVAGGIYVNPYPTVRPVC